ncbi:NUDIX domain-containing protein [Kribbella yunnanensis]|uniref:NUDIX domain-containing protein n=1 Tax=Kribbella yunnanensis TaxID=190194 RepID=UPI0031D30964
MGFRVRPRQRPEFDRHVPTVARRHVEAGELPQDAVRRECLEELGIRVHDATPFPMTVADPTLDVREALHQQTSPGFS